MHGVCLHPGKSFIELKVRLFNRTPLTQTFLWWANIGVHVHELYQSFFPPDVQYVADHAKRAMSRFPLCDGHYYGVNYGERTRNGIPPQEQPPQFIPPGSYPPNDLSWYANIPVPTSYMAMGSKEDFHGGYDHKRGAGLVLVADHHIAPGKKQWTWGNHPFGYAWDRNLTDDDGPYIELMAGVFTDNQPDFSFLAPGETRSFSQFWYPISEIGPPQSANRDLALSLHLSDNVATIGICATQQFPAATVHLKTAGRDIASWRHDLTPNRAFLATADLPSGLSSTEIDVVVESLDGTRLLRYSPLPARKVDVPPPAAQPLLPTEIRGNDELYLTGVHLDQYRHATRHAIDYWLEALRRDPADSRCNSALGNWHLRRGEFPQAEKYFRHAIDTLTQRNPNPPDGEAFYGLGITLRYLRRNDEAYAAFYKATWNYPWRAAAFQALAELACTNGDWNTALDHLELSLRTNADNLNARNLCVVVLRKLGRQSAAAALLQDTLSLDPLDSWSRYLGNSSLPTDNQMRFDLSLDYARAGLHAEAAEILSKMNRDAKDGSAPIMLYALGHFHHHLGDSAAAKADRLAASVASPDYCFPNRLEELLILNEAISANPQDPKAPFYLGNLLYARRRHSEAIALWEQSARMDPTYSTVWRNLGIGYFNVLANPEMARSAFDKAITVNPSDARILYERDQLCKRLGDSPQLRLHEIEKCPELVEMRDDLSVELAGLLNQTHQPEKALALLSSRKFQPWEGGEGLALGQYLRANLLLGHRALARGDAAKARHFFESALLCPENLGEATHPLANQSDVFFLLGNAFEAAGDRSSAQTFWHRAAQQTGDFQDMHVSSFSEMTYYSALSLRKLNRHAEAETLLRELLAYADGLRQQTATIDYFATSLPAMLLFNDDLQKRNTITSTFLQAQARLALGDKPKARELLHEVILLDQNHAHAADLLADLESSQRDQPTL